MKKAFLILSLATVIGFGTVRSQTTNAGGSPPLAAAATPAPPPSAPAMKTTAELQKLVEPIALHPDPLIAMILPASAYPLEIVQAARFVKDTNNIAKLDSQTWDENVKAIARFPDVIAQMDKNLSWTSDLGDAFINQPKETMDAIQTMRTILTRPDTVPAIRGCADRVNGR